MNDWIARIGALRFRLAETRWAALPPIRSEPFLFLQDQTEVRIVRGAGSVLLLIDHRAAPGTLARVERWEPLGPPEGFEVAELVVLSDATRPGTGGSMKRRAQARYIRRPRTSRRSR